MKAAGIAQLAALFQVASHASALSLTGSSHRLGLSGAGAWIPREHQRRSLVLGSRGDPGPTMRLRGGSGGGAQDVMESFRSLPYIQQNIISVVFICAGIFGSVELQGKLREKLPKSLSRKMTHMAVGCFLLMGMAMMPVGHSWPGKLLICMHVYGFMMGFSIAAYIPDKDLERLPTFIRKRIERLVDLCRGGDRIELMGGTFLYCAMISLIVCLLGTSPLGVIAVSALVLGDGLADPIGRWLGSSSALQYKFAWFGQKSYPGSLGCFLATIGGAFAWGRLFQWAGHFGHGFDEVKYMACAAICAALATVSEATSPPMVDNVLIVVSSVLAGFVLKEIGYAPFLTHSNL